MIVDQTISYLTELTGLSIEVIQSLFLGISATIFIAVAILLIRTFKKSKKRRYR